MFSSSPEMKKKSVDNKDDIPASHNFCRLVLEKIKVFPCYKPRSYMSPWQPEFHSNQLKNLM